MYFKVLLRINLLTLSIIFGGSVKAVTEIDSLKNELMKCTCLNDSAKIIYELTWRQEYTNRNDAIKYGLLAYKLSNKIQDTAILANIYDAAQIAFYYTGDIQKTKELNETIIKIGLRHDLYLRLAWSYYNLAYISISEGDMIKAKTLVPKSYMYFKKLNQQRQAFDSYYLLINANQTQYIDTLVQLIERYVPDERDKITQCFYLMEISRLYNLQGNRNKEMYYVLMAMELADKTKNTKGTIKAYFQIANYLSEIQQNYSLALTYYQKSLELNQHYKMLEPSEVYIFIGDMYRHMDKDSLALVYFNHALDDGKQRKHRHTIASAYMKLGELSYQNNRFSEASDYYLKCFNTGCDVCPRIKFHDALIKLANVYLFSNDLKNAGAYYQRSLELADSSNDDRAKIASFQGFASYYEKQGKLTEAIRFYRKAYDLSKEIKFLEGQNFSAGKLGNLYSLQKDYHSAYEYLTISKVLSDSIREMSQTDNLAKLETLFDFKNLQLQRDLDTAKAEKEIARQRFLRNLFIVVLILGSMLAFYIYLGYKRKKKDNILLREQKQANENMLRQVHEADKAKLQFFTNVSHELRTPLTLILGLTEKLIAFLPENKLVPVIRKNSMKLLHLINLLLDLRKIDELKMVLHVNEGNLSAFLKGITGTFEDYARQKGITIVFHPVEKEIIGYFDEDKLEKVFSNLVSNAVKYNRENGQVEVFALEGEEGFVCIEVTDNGVGIAEKELKNIFNRFYRVSESNEQGSGIGLALVKELVELHKGEIIVKSRKGEGSSFKVKIPLEKHFYSDEEISPVENEPGMWNYIGLLHLEDETNMERSSEKPNPDKKSILIVEDNGDLRKYIAGIFTGEYEILEASNGEEGCNLAIEYVPDIIISDIMMPKISGIQLIEKIKNNNATSHIPIILLTAKNDIGTRLSSFEKGADDYISKPFDSAILKSRVENLLRLRKHLVEKFSKQFQLQPREITIEDADQKFLQKTIDIIEKNISNPNLNIDLLAIELGVSRAQLYRKLKALTDNSANQFIRTIRLKRAAQILHQGQNNIAEVMDATGFSNYSYFNNCFKELFGEFPKEYALLCIKGNTN